MVLHDLSVHGTVSPVATRRDMLMTGVGTMAGLVTVALPSAASAASTTGTTSPPLLPAEQPSADLDVRLLSSPSRVEILWFHNEGTMPFNYTYTVKTYPVGGLESSAVTRTSGTLTSVSTPTYSLVWTNDTGTQLRIKVEYSSITTPAKTDATGWNVINA